MITEDRVFNWTMAGLAFAAIMALSWSAKAQEQQPTCFPYKTVQQSLAAEHFQEMAVGVNSTEDAVFTVFANDKAEWSMWALNTKGLACLMDKGTGFFARATGRLS
jgi:hypothetical protein